MARIREYEARIKGTGRGNFNILPSSLPQYGRNDHPGASCSYLVQLEALASRGWADRVGWGWAGWVGWLWAGRVGSPGGGWAGRVGRVGWLDGRWGAGWVDASGRMYRSWRSYINTFRAMYIS